MRARTIGFVGFGEAAQCFARHLVANSAAKVLAFCDGRTNRPPYSDSFRALAMDIGAELVDTLDALLARVDIVFSAVTVATADAVGAAIAGGIRQGTLVIDINAATPSRKAAIAEAVKIEGGAYVDANLMGAVSIYGAKVPLYCSGDGVEQFVSIFGPLGFAIESAGERPGAAAAVKMLRSVVTKGIEALVIEAMVAASVAGVRSEALRGICEPMDATRFSTFVDMCIRTDVLHAERRAVEMDGVAKGIEELGLAPLMTRSTAARLRASAALGQRDAFLGGQGYTADDVLDAYAIAESERSRA
jgi:3-hydroxyisobutyrate dehydrogenase-like beta-hydroxyacid dehydrogenase